MPTFDWYELVSTSSSLEQGDLLDDFPLVSPSFDQLVSPSNQQQDKPEIPVQFFNVIVMTQSCDLADSNDEDPVVLCPREDYARLYDRLPSRRRSGLWGSLIRGHVIHLHLTNRCEIKGHEFDYQVIDLGHAFTAPLHLVKALALRQGERIRLLPPYREHVAQAFARQFMRVGLPIDLSREDPAQS